MGEEERAVDTSVRVFLPDDDEVSEEEGFEEDSA
jgi:hypothetical protein